MRIVKCDRWKMREHRKTDEVIDIGCLLTALALLSTI